MTAYRTRWLGLEYDGETVESSEAKGNGVLQSVSWRDGEPRSRGAQPRLILGVEGCRRGIALTIVSSHSERHGRMSSRNSEHGVVTRQKSSFPRRHWVVTCGVQGSLCAPAGVQARPWGRVTTMTERTRRSFGRSRIDAVEQALERWLLRQAQAGVPELVLVGLLRDYADVTEHRGVIPRSWDEPLRKSQHSTRRPPRRWVFLSFYTVSSQDRTDQRRSTSTGTVGRPSTHSSTPTQRWVDTSRVSIGMAIMSVKSVGQSSRRWPNLV